MNWFEKNLNFDRWILVVVFTLAFLGLVMVYSTSSVLATDRYHNPYHFLKLGIIYLCLGLCLIIFFMHLDHNRLRFFSGMVLFIAILLLIAVLFFPAIRGAHRWLRFGMFRFQPSELAKLAMVIYLSHSLAKREDKLREFAKGVMPYLGITALIVVLVLAEPDFGGAIVIALLSGILLYTAGVKLKYLALSGAIAFVLGLTFLAQTEHNIERLICFLDPWKYRSEEAYQLIESFLAFGSGGLFGVGLGMSRIKMHFLPDAHTDFILAVIAEEAGFIGVFVIILLFGVFLTRGVWVSLYAPDAYSRYLAMGLTMMIVMPAVVNMAVVTGLLPTKGLVLPFISYGGSSLLINMSAAGILLNISAKRLRG